MREEQPVPGDESPEASTPQEHGTLVVLNPDGERIATATLWMRSTFEDQIIIAVPWLRVEQNSSLRIATGAGLNEVFHNCTLETTGWAREAIFVGGTWMLWRSGAPLLTESGFVIGSTMDIARAVRGLRKLLR